MKYICMALVLAMCAGGARAQVPLVAPAPVPQEGVLETQRNLHAVDANGNRVDSQSTTYRDANGVVRDSKTTETRRSPPPPPPPVSTTTTTSTSTSSVPN